MKSLSMLIPVLLVLIGFGSVVQAEVSPQQKLMAKRAAELDAYRKMAERILGLQLTAETHVRDFVGESDQIITYVEEFIKGVRFTNVQYYDDGSCEAEAEVTIRQVIRTLDEAVDKFYDGRDWTTKSFRNIDEYTQDTVIAVVGCGAVRANSDIQDPADAEIIEPALNPRDRTIHLPDIFRQQPPAERLKAKRAAEVDAYRKLLERIYGLQISSDTRVRDFVTESDDIRTFVEGEIKGVRFANTRYQPDGVVEVEAQVTIQQVVQTLKRTCDKVYRGGKWRSETFEEIEKRTNRRAVVVVGVGALDIGGRGGSTSGTEDVIDVDEVIVIE